MRNAYVVCGSPKAGTSRYGRRLSADSGAVVLDIDTVTERLVRAGLVLAQQDPDDRDSDDLKETFRQPIYETLFHIARENLQWNNVDIVGLFTRELRNSQWPSKLSEIFRSHVEIHHL